MNKGQKDGAGSYSCSGPICMVWLHERKNRQREGKVHTIKLFFKLLSKLVDTV